MTARLDLRMPEIMEVEFAARQIIAALHRRPPLFAFPRGMAWRCRFLRWLPAGLSDRLIRRMLELMAKTEPGK
jgi:hypothetical protein